MPKYSKLNINCANNINCGRFLYMHVDEWKLRYVS